MKPGTIRSGIDVIGLVPWGTHFGLFYKTKRDLIDVLVPYFVAGLKNNEFCLWVTAEPLNAEEASTLMAGAMPDFNAYIERGQIEIISHTDLYKIDGKFDGTRVLNGLIDKLGKVRERGFSGLRATGNESWLEKSDWKGFIDYEQSINDVIGQHNMLALCAYSLDKCDANDILEVVSTHQFALSKRNGTWKIIEDQGQKKARKALRESERRFRGIYEQAPLGIARIDSTTGRFLQINQKYCDIVGHTMDEMLATDFQSITHPDDLQEDLGNMARLLAGEIKSFNMEKRYCHANGSIVPVDLTVVPLWDEEESYKFHIAMVEDITNRKRVEESLHTTLQRFYSILSGMYPSILLVTEEDRVEFANQAFCDYFDLEELPGDLAGLTSSEMIEKIKGVYQHPDREIARIREIVSRGQPVRGEEVALRNGRTCLRDFVPLYVEGRRYGRLWLHLDISERKQAEIKLEEAKAQAKLYVDLMGHDINNMHQIALGYLELARDMQPDVGQTEFIDRPVEVLQRSARLIKNVRKLQKLRDGMLRIEVVDVGKVLADVQREFGEVPDKMVTLNLNGRENCLVHANELLHDVFANLVSNAIKHTGDHADIAIDLDIVEGDGRQYCRVMVEDDGPGIPDDFKGRIFNRLLKGTDKAKGMGLGLYLVKSLVESYGGRVWVGDRIAGDHTKGARFVVMLPMAEK